MEVGIEPVVLLLAAALAAGLVDAIAGGGGLLTVPALLLAGADPVTALATNKLQGLFGAGSAALAYARAGQVDLRAQAAPALLAGLASGGGALLAMQLPTEVVGRAIPGLLLLVAAWFALKPGLDDLDRAVRLKPAAFALGVVPAIAFYDGLLGPGAGSFYAMAFVALAGFGLLKATAHTKFLNFASNCGAMAAFALLAAPWWLTGLAMGLAQVAGAALGARLALRFGARLIRPLLVLAATAMALRLLWQAPG